IFFSSNGAFQIVILLRSYESPFSIAIQMGSKGCDYIIMETRREEIDMLLIVKSEERFRFRSDRILVYFLRYRKSDFGILIRLKYLIGTGPNQIGITLRIVDS